MAETSITYQVPALKRPMEVGCPSESLVRSEGAKVNHYCEKAPPRAQDEGLAEMARS